MQGFFEQPHFRKLAQHLHPYGCIRPAGLHRHLGEQENIRWDFWSEGGPMGYVDCPADPEGCSDNPGEALAVASGPPNGRRWLP
jgi:hypothetical protein